MQLMPDTAGGRPSTSNTRLSPRRTSWPARASCASCSISTRNVPTSPSPSTTPARRLCSTTAACRRFGDTIGLRQERFRASSPTRAAQQRLRRFGCRAHGGGSRTKKPRRSAERGVSWLEKTLRSPLVSPMSSFAMYYPRAAAARSHRALRRLLLKSARASHVVSVSLTAVTLLRSAARGFEQLRRVHPARVEEGMRRARTTAPPAGCAQDIKSAAQSALGIARRNLESVRATSARVRPLYAFSRRAGRRRSPRRLPSRQARGVTRWTRRATPHRRTAAGKRGGVGVSGCGPRDSPSTTLALRQTRRSLEDESPR